MDGNVRLIETAPGVKLSVRIAGAGPLVILMHGWPELGLSWRHQVAPLAAAGYTVAVPDMRGYGGSSKPRQVEAYSADALADDMMAIAAALGAQRWVAVGHDWGAPVAWRCALRFPDAVAGVFALSVPHMAAMPISSQQAFELMYPDSFYYVRYFQEVGPAEVELERDARAALKTIFFALSGDAPKGEWAKPRPKNASLLPGLAVPPAGPLSFMSDKELDEYAAAFRTGGFNGSLNWYRTIDLNAEQASAYGDQRIKQPAGFLCGDKEIVPGAGHWIQQERPVEVTRALVDFLQGVWSGAAR